MTRTPDYSQYEKLCSLLNDVHCEEFLSASMDYPNFRCQLIEADAFRSPPSQEEWQRFIEVNHGTNLPSDAAWEKWEVFPDRTACARFFGTGSEEAHCEFVRIAKASYRILAAISDLAKTAGCVPEDCEVNLPNPNKSGRWCPLSDEFGWLEVLFDTGKFCHTGLLHAETKLWGNPITPDMIQQLAADKGSDAWQVADSELFDEFFHKPLDLGNNSCFPCHPLVHSLDYDVFLSSTEAIYIWFGNDNVVWIDILDNPPAFLPPVVAADVTDEMPICHEVTIDIGDTGYVLKSDKGRRCSVPREYKKLFGLFTTKVLEGAPGEIIEWSIVNPELGGSSTSKIGDTKSRKNKSVLDQHLLKDLGPTPNGDHWILSVYGKGCHLNTSVEWSVGRTLSKDTSNPSVESVLTDGQKMGKNTPNPDEKLPAKSRLPGPKHEPGDDNWS